MLASLIDSIKTTIQSGQCSISTLESYFNQLNAIEKEIQKGAGSLLATTLRRVAFFQACAVGQLAIVKYLIEQDKSLIEAEDSSHGQFTGLMTSTEGNQLEIAQFLLSSGAEVNKRTGPRKISALFIACEKGHVSIAQLLLDHPGANPNLEANKASVSYGYFSVPCLHTASENNHLEIVKLLLTHNASINGKTSYGETPLLLASRKGHLTLVQFLLEKFADPNIADIYNNTPLIVACQNNHLDIARLLLAHGVEDVNKRGRYDALALRGACENRNIEMAKLLLQYNVDPNLGLCLDVSISRNHFEMVELLLVHGAKVGASSFEDACEKGYIDMVQFLHTHHGAEITVESLTTACRHGHTEVVQYLLDHGADVNESPEPFEWAADNDHLEVVKLLVTRGADVNQNDGAALKFACYHGHVETARYLLEHNSITSALDSGGETLLMVAIENTHLEIAKLLLDFGVDINRQDNDGKTALFIACKQTNAAAVSLLLEHKADPNIRTLMEESPLFLCIENNNAEIARLLLDNGAAAAVDQRIFDQDKVEIKYSPLSDASAQGSLRAVELLLRNGADVNAKDIFGNTPLMAAAENGHTHIAEFLIKKGANVTEKNSCGGTALTAAVDNGTIELFELLIKNGASKVDGFRSSIFIEAAFYGHVPLLAWLLKDGSNIHEKDSRGSTALIEASKYIDAMKFLIQNGALVNAQTNSGNSALHEVASCTTIHMTETIEIIRVLIANGADATLVNHLGQTPFDTAWNGAIRAELVKAIEDRKSGKLDHLIIR